MSGDKDFRRLEDYVRGAQGGLYRAIERMENLMSTLVDDLKKEVSRNTETVASAVQLLTMLTDRLQHAVDNDDVGKVQEIIDDVRNAADTLGAAVTANTPHEQQPPAPTPDVPPPVPDTPADPVPVDPAPVDNSEPTPTG